MCITHSSGTQLYHKTRLEDKKPRQVSLILVFCKRNIQSVIGTQWRFFHVKDFTEVLECSVRNKQTLKFIYVNHSHIGSLEEIKYYILMYLNFTAGLHRLFSSLYLSWHQQMLWSLSSSLCFKYNLGKLQCIYHVIFKSINICDALWERCNVEIFYSFTYYHDWMLVDWSHKLFL
jgi:hypothetical protein